MNLQKCKNYRLKLREVDEKMLTPKFCVETLKNLTVFYYLSTENFIKNQ